MLRRFSRPIILSSLSCVMLLAACEDRRQDNSEQVAPGIHVEKVDASQCPTLGEPTKRIVIEGTAFSIATPAKFDVTQRETKVAREVIMKRVLEAEGSGSLTIRVIIDSTARAPGSNESLKSADTSPAGPVNKTIGTFELEGQELPIRLTDRGLDVTQRVFIPRENDTELAVTLMTGVSATRACHKPLADLGTEVLRSLQHNSP